MRADGVFALSMLLTLAAASYVGFPLPPNGTTCTPYNVVWTYSRAISDGTLPFSLEVTNIGVPQSAPNLPTPSPSSTATTTSPTSPTPSLPGSTLPTVSSTSDFGTAPGPGPTDPPQSTQPFRARQAASFVVNSIIANVTLAENSHSFEWDASVPPGWYIFNGTDPTGVLTFDSSERFFIAPGDLSCIKPGSTSAPAPSPTDTASAPAATTAGKNRPGIIAGAVVGVFAGVAIVAGIWFALCTRVRARASNNDRSRPAPRYHSSKWDQVGSHDSRPPVATGMPESGLAARAAAASLHQGGSGSALGHGSAHGHGSALGHGTDDDTDSLAEKGSPGGFHRRDSYPLGPLPRSGLPPGAKRTPRKAVPAYDAREMALAAALSNDEDADTTVVGSHGSASVLRKQSSRELYGLGNGSNKQLHYLIPDMPASPRQ